MKLIRRQFLISGYHDVFLSTLAEQETRSQNEVLRDALDRYAVSTEGVSTNAYYPFCGKLIMDDNGGVLHFEVNELHLSNRMISMRCKGYNHMFYVTPLKFPHFKP